jgi:predicted CoA-binding protein
MGHRVFPVRPGIDTILGLPCHEHLRDIKQPLHTITLYVGPDISSMLAGEIILAKPVRVIFNPGAENPELASLLQEAGIVTEEACTLVMLRTGEF